ncbi:MAG: hypothetical protein SWH68_08230 [Thermodesulfobacteriota bacterium]|nr:hypothetical protein [Thermodesulfobacteriota bacterium]
MIVLLNGKKIDVDPAAVNLETVIQSVQCTHLSDSDVVWSVIVNEQPYSEARANAAQDVPVSEVYTLEIITISKEELINKFLENSGKIVSILKEGAMEISAAMRSGDVEASSRQFYDFLEVCRNFVNMAAATNSYSESLPEGAQGPDEERLKAVSRSLDEAFDAQKHEDWGRLANALEDDIYPAIESLNAAF